MFACQRVPVIDIRMPSQAVISAHFNGFCRLFYTVGVGRLRESLFLSRPPSHPKRHDHED